MENDPLWNHSHVHSVLENIFRAARRCLYTSKGNTSLILVSPQLTGEFQMMKTIQSTAFQIKITKSKYDQDPNSWAQLKGLQLQPKLLLLSFLSILCDQGENYYFLKPPKSLSISLVWQCKFVCQHDDHDMKPTTALCIRPHEFCYSIKLRSTFYLLQ